MSRRNRGAGATLTVWGWGLLVVGAVSLVATLAATLSEIGGLHY